MPDPSFPIPRRLVCAACLLALGAGVLHAQPVPAATPAASTPAPTATPQASDPAPTAVIISGRRQKAVELPPTESTTVIDAAVIERRQSSSIFDIVKDAPGVSIDGGPRTTGMKFNIRGFGGNDDVLFKIDGGVKGFDKYRFGSGVFIEPELIKSITIERGPSILTGSGAIGGTIIATTKNAADLLGPGERAGGLVKLGYDTNSHERLRMLSAFGRPTDRTDLLVSWVARDSKDFRLGDGGGRFPASANQLEGTLVKFGWTPIDDLFVELSRTGYRSGPTYTPYDANSSTAGVGGYVHQKVDDETINLKFTYEPPQSWIKLRGTVAHETTRLNNLMKPGESTFATPCQSATSPCEWTDTQTGTGDMHDHWNYDIWTAEVFNDTRWQLGPVDSVLTVGVQALVNQRDLKRLTENPYKNAPGGQYPDGFDEQQPPGTKRSLAYVVQNAFTWSQFTVAPGLRWDRYSFDADGQAALNRRALGLDTGYSLERTTPSMSLTWRPRSDWWLTYRWVKSFRPPLLTDYFGLDAANPCGAFQNPDQTQRFPDGCGDRIKPTESLNRELTLAWTPRWESGATTQARLTLYRIDSRKLNGASYTDVVDGRIVQPAREKRRGAELEVTHDAPDWYAMFNLSRILAERTGIDGTTAAFTKGIPGTTAVLSGGYRFLGGELELGYRLRQLWDQKVSGGTALTPSTQYCGKVTSKGIVHAANTQQDVYAIWKPMRRVTLQAGVHNLFDKHWCNNGDELGNSIGLQGPGRSVRVSMTVQY